MQTERIKCRFHIIKKKKIYSAGKKKPRDLDKTAAVSKQGAFNNERCVQFLKDATYEIVCYRELKTCEKEPLRGLTETADNVQMILKTAQQTPNTSRSVRIDNIRAL